MKSLSWALIGSCALVLPGCLESRYDSQWNGKTAPDFELNDLEGNSFRLSDFRGKPVLISFWAHG